MNQVQESARHLRAPAPICVFVLWAMSAQSQTVQPPHSVSGDEAKWAISMAGVVEPPELTGEPKKVFQASAAQREFGEITKRLSTKDQEKAKSARSDLAKFLQLHPAYSDAYVIRATADLCVLGRRDYVSALRDINMAISTYSSPRSESIYDDLIDHYSLRGKIEMILGQKREALDDLETAMKFHLSNADKIFSISGTEPVG